MNKPIGKVLLEGYRCRCGHEWLARNKHAPIRCSKCMRQLILLTHEERSEIQRRAITLMWAKRKELSPTQTPAQTPAQTPIQGGGPKEWQGAGAPYSLETRRLNLQKQLNREGKSIGFEEESYG